MTVPAQEPGYQCGFSGGWRCDCQLKRDEEGGWLWEVMGATSNELVEHRETSESQFLPPRVSRSSAQGTSFAFCFIVWVPESTSRYTEIFQ